MLGHCHPFVKWFFDSIRYRQASAILRCEGKRPEGTINQSPYKVALGKNTKNRRKKSGLCNTSSMPKKIDFTLTQADLQIVIQAIKSDKRPEVRQRAMGIRLLHEGQSPQEIAPRYAFIRITSSYSRENA